jgi:hypothetical protein
MSQSRPAGGGFQKNVRGGLREKIKRGVRVRKRETKKKGEREASLVQSANCKV